MSTNGTVTVALVSDVFYHPDGESRLRARLAEARDRGATIAVLPELPLNPWSPATKQARDDDAEAPGGPRHRLQAAAAGACGIGLVGGAIVRDPLTGRRLNTALVFDGAGALVATFAKQHVPQEEGFWESSHYGAGDEPSPVITSMGIPFGVQICSDINRPEGCHLLGAMGAEAVLAPRATELRTAERWKIVFRANALTSTMFVLSVNRPAPEQGVLIGGPSFAVAPDGRVLLESTETVAVVVLDRSLVAQARHDYPGYLPIRSDVYSKAWARVSPKGYGPG